MTLSIAAASYLNRTYPAATANTSSATNTPASPTDNSTPQVGVTSGPISLASLSTSGLPQVQLPSDMLAQIQSGSVFRAPDPAKTAAQNSTPAYSIIKDASTGQVLGGVWPGVGNVSKVNIANDDRLTGNTDYSQVTQYLADDIAKYTGKNVTVETFQLGDPTAPTFGSVMGMD